MSTILKALQKLEQEKDPNRLSSPTPVFSKPYSTTGGVAGWILNPWVRRTAVGFILVALSATAFYFYLQSRSHGPQRRDGNPAMEKPATAAKTHPEQPSPPSTPPIAKMDSKPAGSENAIRPDQSTSALPSPVSQARSNTPGVDRNVQEPGQPAISKARQPQVQEQSIQAQMRPETPDRLPNNALQRPGAGSKTAAEISAPPADNANNKPAPATSARETRVAAEKKAPPDTYKNTPPLTDGRLKVHAIAWSAVAENRMAVVNNRVIYEGDSVDGFVVVAIRPDDVVVREKEKGLWRVVFGRP